MTNKQINKLEKQIEALKGEMMAIGPMRPGTLTIQYKDRENQTGGYHQLSYTHKKKSRTEYVREEHVARLRAEIEQYKRWRELIERWVELSIELSREKIAELKLKKTR
jgi:hypothetical protein